MKEEDSMKLFREFKDEQVAHARERALQALGYRAWVNHKSDGSWLLFWFERAN